MDSSRRYRANAALPQDNPSQEQLLATIKPSLLVAGPRIITATLRAGVVTWLLFAFNDITLAMATFIASLTGGFFPYDTWDKWLIGAVWVVNFIPVVTILAMALTTRFDITNQRLIYNYGITKRYQEPIELAKIRDQGTLKVWYQRPFGLGSLRIDSADRSHPELIIPAQRHVNDLKDWLHQLSMAEKSRLGYREFENTADV